MPSTAVNDGPCFDAGTTGGQPWEPKNYDGTFEGPAAAPGADEGPRTWCRSASCSRSARYAQDWIGNFGFEREKHPAYLPMALGAGSVTPMDARRFRCSPTAATASIPTITKITDHKDKVLVDVQPLLLNESMRAIPQRNAFIMDSLLQSVASGGTAAKAQATLKRTDLYGKTGTTNDSLDAWFAGFQPTNAARADGRRRPASWATAKTGGGLSLPIWISFMQTALKACRWPNCRRRRAWCRSQASTDRLHARPRQSSRWWKRGAGQRRPECCAGRRQRRAAEERKRISTGLHRRPGAADAGFLLAQKGGQASLQGRPRDRSNSSSPVLVSSQRWPSCR